MYYTTCNIQSCWLKLSVVPQKNFPEFVGIIYRNFSTSGALSIITSSLKVKLRIKKCTLTSFVALGMQSKENVLPPKKTENQQLGSLSRQCSSTPVGFGQLSLILRRCRTGTVWFYTCTSNKRAARPKLYTKSLTRDLKLMYSRFTLVRISIKL